jgi:preprotein translocase subunit SecG
MSIVIGFLTLVLVLVSLFLILLVLVQLPKKEAGVGMAFGAGMSEMLLGAGSGNVLTRITKYTVGLFLALSLVLSIMIASQYRRSGLAVTRAIEEQARSTAPQTATPPPTTPGIQPLPATTNIVTTPTGGPPGALTLPLINTGAPATEPTPLVPTPAPTSAPASAPPQPQAGDATPPTLNPPADAPGNPPEVTAPSTNPAGAAP